MNRLNTQTKISLSKAMENQNYTISKYIIKRLEEAGLKHIFGVPGDYVLDFIDDITDSSIKWIGNCNELNAGYAADGYARYTGLGAAVVTYGVGAFSILNAIAGAYAEQVPLLLISGAPASARRLSNTLMHHLIHDYMLQYDVFRKVTIDAAFLTNPQTAPEEVDRVITNCIVYKRPVYLELPMDSIKMQCSVPKSISFKIERTSHSQSLKACSEEVAEMINKAKNPVILVGAEVLRSGNTKQVLSFIERSELPFATTASSKSSLPEFHPQYIGLYTGSLSKEYVKKQIEDSDCVLSLGVWMTDFDTGAFTTKIDEKNIIKCNSDQVLMHHHYYNQILINDLLNELTPIVKARQFLESRPRKPYIPSRDFTAVPEKTILTSRFYEKINSILNDDLILIADTGDPIFACSELQIEEPENFLGQPYYLSIGYSTPASLGVSLARPKKRTLIITGDGAFQMTAQELSSHLRYKTNAIIFLLNNEGYTIERFLHKDNIYNDIQNWKYHKLPEVFGDNTLSFDVHTEGDLETAVEIVLKTKDKLGFIEVHFDKLDCSDSLKNFAENLQKLAKKK
jgi:TPP-dependent 2-oxoacid decarboxylase